MQIPFLDAFAFCFVIRHSVFCSFVSSAVVPAFIALVLVGVGWSLLCSRSANQREGKMEETVIKVLWTKCELLWMPLKMRWVAYERHIR